jgi:hypothetical protein
MNLNLVTLSAKCWGRDDWQKDRSGAYWSQKTRGTRRIRYGYSRRLRLSWRKRGISPGEDDILSDREDERDLTLLFQSDWILSHTELIRECLCELASIIQKIEALFGVNFQKEANKKYSSIAGQRWSRLEGFGTLRSHPCRRSSNSVSLRYPEKYLRYLSRWLLVSCQNDLTIIDISIDC